jgi:2-polyprenyl-6-methoxyphenol hydroxylase-like FAD-dependent oxidoreductase
MPKDKISNMKILIIGGGIGGLAAAGFFEKKGFDITLIEKAPEFKHIGFSLSLFPDGRRMLRELGIDEEVSKDGYEVEWMEIADTKGKMIGNKIYFKDFLKFGEPIVSIHRADLHEALVKNLKSTKIRLGTTYKEIKNEKEKTHVVFNDDSKDSFDLIVASDGINSKVRENFFGHGEVTHYGWSLRFFWIPKHVPVPRGALCLSKEGANLVIYPTKHSSCIGIYEYNPLRTDHPPLRIDDFLPYLKRHGWTQEHLDDVYKEANEGHQYYDHLRHVDMGEWYKKRIVLLGDARHGMSPITGMGASMALEDAYVLADELAKVEKADIDIALTNYSNRRAKRVKEVISLSRFAEQFYFIKNTFEKWWRNLFLRVVPNQIVVNKIAKILGRNL